MVQLFPLKGGGSEWMDIVGNTYGAAHFSHWQPLPKPQGPAEGGGCGRAC